MGVMVIAGPCLSGADIARRDCFGRRCEVVSCGLMNIARCTYK